MISQTWPGLKSHWIEHIMHWGRKKICRCDHAFICVKSDRKYIVTIILWQHWNVLSLKIVFLGFPSLFLNIVWVHGFGFCVWEHVGWILQLKRRGLWILVRRLRSRSEAVSPPNSFTNFWRRHGLMGSFLQTGFDRVRFAALLSAIKSGDCEISYT